MLVHLLEDDPGVSESLSLLIENLGFAVVAHRAAESFFRRSPPGSEDVVFVDLELPGVSGRRIIRWLRCLKDPPRIVVISGQPQGAIDAELRKLRDWRPQHLLRKPLNGEVVVAQLERAVGAPAGALPGT
jgi:FixJ family two-component response regulator